MHMYFDNVIFSRKSLSCSLDVTTGVQNIVSIATVGKRRSLTLNKLIQVEIGEIG